MARDARHPAVRRFGLLVMIALAVAMLVGQPSALVVTGGVLLIVFTVFGGRSRGTPLSADVPHDRVQVSAQAAMLEVMLADGVLDDDEASRAVGVYRELTSIDMPVDAIRVQAQVALSDGDDLRGMLEVFAAELTRDEKATVLKAAVMVAVGDGELDAAEQPAVARVARALGLGPDDVRAVVGTMAGRGSPLGSAPR